MKDWNQTLLIPVSLEAFVVNDRVQSTGRLRRWQMEFNRLIREKQSPESEPFDDSDSQVRQGVYLHWQLPEVLRRGEQQSGGDVLFPLLPNRWLLTRLDGSAEPRFKSWLIKSDALGEANSANSSRYVRPTENGLVIERLGASCTVTDWASMEESDADLFLTAVGYGHTQFLAYQPLINNVFSFFDPADDVDRDQPLSYLVIGWYSRGDADILSQQEMEELQWLLKDQRKAPEKPKNSLFHGSVCQVAWNTAAHATERLKNIQVAIGHNSIEAFHALLKKWAAYRGFGDQAIHADLIKAFQYGMLRDLDAPDGEQLLRNASHRQGFASRQGGVVWEIVATRLSGEKDAVQSLTDGETAFLQTLCQAQSRFEAERRLILDLQQQLYEIGWKSSLPQRLLAQFIPDFAERRDEYTAQLAAETARLQEDISQKKQAIRTVYTRAFPGFPEIPYDTDTDAFTEELNSYARRQGILQPRNKLLPGSGDPFWQPNDPVLMITGLDYPSADENRDFYCRLPEELRFAKDAPSLPAVLPDAPLPVLHLLREFFMISQGREAECTGILPAAFAIPKWRQPWRPLFLEWEVVWYPIPFEHWSFDGKEYTLTGNYQAEESSGKRIKGRTMIHSHSTALLKDQLEEFAGQMEGQSGEVLKGFLDGMRGWDFISQTLSGLHNQLSQRSAEFLIKPDQTIAAFVDDNYSLLPDLVNKPELFQHLRHGQFYFNQLLAYDGFGQAVVLVQDPNGKYPGMNSADFFRPIAADDFRPTPEKTVVNRNPGRFLQCTPRLLRPGRLRLEWTDAVPAEGAAASEVNPVCGWLIPDRVRHGIFVYSPEGMYAGGLYPAGTDVKWISAPQKTEPLNDHLSGLIEAARNLSAGEFQYWIQIIDEALWTIQPGDAEEQNQLAVIAGRPLALVRGKLSLELDGQPFSDPFWPGPAAKTARLSDYPFHVRIGDSALRKDGVIGYFLNDRYTSFCAVRAERETGFIQKMSSDHDITLHYGTNEETFVTMLVDPSAQIHLSTGILPVQAVALSQRVTVRAMKQMEIYLRFGPLLTETFYEKVPGVPDEKCLQQMIHLPGIPETEGNWVWMQQAKDGHWQHLSLKEGKSEPFANGCIANLTEGWLKLTKPSQPKE